MIGANEFTLEDRHLNVCTVFQHSQDYHRTLKALSDQGVALKSLGEHSTMAKDLSRHEVQRAVREVSA